MRLAPPRGTRDFYPDDMRIRDWLFGLWREVSEAHGFEDYDAPVVEHEELYVRKAGEEITKQLYHFELHGRHLALRPELTPSISRMVIARAGALRLPVRWFTIGQNWRYERMTRGRKREHYQWDAEILGEPGVAAEAELLARLRHPGIAQIHEAGTAPLPTPAGVVPLPYIAMELIEGAVTLREHLSRQAPPLSERLALLEDVARAVHHAHQGNHAQIVVEPGIHDERLQRRIGIAFRRRDAGDQLLEQLRDPLARLRADAKDVIGCQPDDVLDFRSNPLRLGLRKVDLVQYRQHL